MEIIWDTFRCATSSHAGWETSVAVTIPDDMPSGPYALHVSCGESGPGATRESYIAFFVRPPRLNKARGKRPDMAVLAPTCSYLAYANHAEHIHSGSQGYCCLEAKLRKKPEMRYHRKTKAGNHPTNSTFPGFARADFGRKLVTAKRSPGIIGSRIRTHNYQEKEG